MLMHTRYCGSSDGYCAATTCQKDFGFCNSSGAQPSPIQSTLSSVVVSVRSSTPVPSNPATCSPSTVTLTTTAPFKTCYPVTISQSASAITTTLNIPGQGQFTTVTVPTTVTLPGEDVTTSITVLVAVTGTTTTTRTQLSSVRVPVTTTLVFPPTTVTLPGETTTVTLPGEKTTVTVPVTSTVTVPGPTF
jgi:hypothetical protein